MEKILREYLEEDFFKEDLKEEFDYKFNLTYEKEKFVIEFKKFLGIYNCFFYDKNRLVTVFNSYEISIKEDKIKHLFLLYEYAEINNFENEKNILIDFLITYYNTLNTKEYREKVSQYNTLKNEFFKILREKKLEKKFFNDFYDILFEFYKKVIMFGIKNEIFIDPRLINKIFNNLEKKVNQYNELINIFISNEKNLYNVVSFDHEKKIHLDAYLKYILCSLEKFGGYNYAKEMYCILDKDNCIDEDSNKKIINKYVDVANEKIDILSDKNYSFIQAIAEIDELNEELNYILENIKSLSKVQKEKAKEIVIKLLSLKRYLVSDDNYVKSEMIERTYEQKIETREVESYVSSLLENEFKLYSASRVDFISQMKNALEIYSKYPLQSIFSNYNIDSKNQIYLKNIAFREKSELDKFKKYFDDLGEKYTRDHPELLNKLNGNYYEELLRYLSKVFFMHQNLLLMMLNKDNFNKIINKLKKSIKYDYENDYAIIVSNVLAIEANILEIMKNKNIELQENEFLNLNKLFEYFNKDKDVVNGLMYINYILYEKSGMNIRNNAMHGTLIGDELEIYLLVTFAGLIFISWLLNER